jgi:hypothetical protein
MNGLRPRPFADPAVTGQQSFLQEIKAAALALHLFQIIESVSQTVVSATIGVQFVILPLLAAGAPNFAFTRS